MLRSLPVTFLRNMRSSVPRRYLSSLMLKETGYGCVQKLRNNLDKGEESLDYAKRSWAEFNELLRPDQFYVYVDKAVLRKGVLYPGHIACFLTEEKVGRIAANTFISLRNGDPQPDLKLSGYLSHDNTRQHRSYSIYKIKFLDDFDELKTYFFDTAVSSVSPEKGGQRFLISIKRDLVLENLKDLPRYQARLDRMKTDYCSKKLYVLIDGVLSDGVFNEPTTSFNCVNGFYGAIEASRGSVPNPSPQMALWSFLKAVLGEEERNSFISGTGLKDAAVERVFDDSLVMRKTFMTSI